MEEADLYSDSICFDYEEIYNLEPLVLRGKKEKVAGRPRKVAKQIEYIPTVNTEAMVADINRYNRKMEDADVTIPYPISIPDVMDPMTDIIYHNVDEATEYIESIKDLMLEASDSGSLWNEVITYSSPLVTKSNTATSIYRYKSNTSNHIPYSKGIYPITKSFCYKHIYYKKLRPYLHRVYNNNNFNEGGRFYGAQYQQLNSDQRKHIKINCYPTVELDYKALRPSMLFNALGKELEGDPYDLFDGNHLLRKATKLMFNMALNAALECDAYRAYNSTLCGFKTKSEDSYENYQLRIQDKKPIIHEMKNNNLKSKDILNAIREAHPLFEEYICSGYGLKLQNKDSNMAAAILNHFTNEDIPCLCIHDSFIVPFIHANELEDIMKSTYSKFNNGYECAVELK